ncbi:MULTISPECIES: type II toxin-antitoxin system PemK/MazF family toxin [Rhizobium]|uniref:mRNA-degrading endonuclease toxin of MazEF toxin-antitoxin module n=1 Tax=Rhizobium paranaense TaxID=1650438 RepID=A0A7W8XX50_9HYPH|nr:type II toxin-antitoxin system PemK/MazF family toxin [Rhizobium paranaense]MBB5577212.1 mRNA-degrading endonuclease toxin of MazEF toxin-antitoxin module [Rhizobium paranaense]
MLERGQIVRFHYLWAHQAQVGEESGRKARPVCIVVRTPGNPGAVYLFPITSQEPQPERVALSFPEMECRRAGLSSPCWIILDEYNRVELDKAFDFESTKPIGNVSPAFLEKVAVAVKKASVNRLTKGVTRS